MKMSYTTLLLTIFLASVFSLCAISDSEVNGPPKAVSDTKIPSILKKDDLNKQLEPKNEGKKLNGGESRDDRTDNKGLKDNKGLNSKSKEGSLSPPREKCDPSSNSCTDDDKTLIACLRVPGDDSPDLSLLIQNEGKGLVKVAILAPDSVQLEKKEVQIPAMEYSVVRVSIKSAGSSDSIILTAGHGNCSLDFRDQVGRKNLDSTSEFSYINHLKRNTSIGFLLLAALAILSVWSCIKFLRKHFVRNPKYQKLDMELPVSHGSKVESESKEGWDDTWGDSWDDEEASKTPSLPVTPSLSSKGIASRRFNKEGWKD